ncbi:amino acid adenylation domain-containing protein [Kitasatospora sp. NBC_01250]|uniref:amino acid adenylation domain-containing protein n=1 Tax=Kitasatospora sp. NBC_01250 TaxID=2903571 RepID=UPI002E36BB41|nr:amino acid adenylation domain-containing protein [Kitasatospora sp. NBC_01250]
MPDPSAPAATLYEWFARTVARQPHAPALEVGGSAYSYQELSRITDQLAGRILARHGGPPQRVALLASRSLVAYAGYLAAQRLGAAVTPLNPEHPAVRNRAVCALAGTQLLIADRAGAERWQSADAEPGPPLLALGDEELTGEPVAALPPYRTTGDDLAYVLFTSGSTGRPKGVPIRHRNIAPYIAHNIARFELAPGDRASQTFDLTFDPSLFDLFVTWGAGATLVVPQRSDLLTPVTYLVERGITHWFSVPSLVSVSAALGNLPTGLVHALRYSIFAGEQLTYRQAEAWHAVAPGSVIANIYGPTELTVTVTEYRLPAERERWPQTSNDSVPIGPVHAHLDHLVLDEQGREAAEGELCVRGSQRFDGYLDPADNRGRFLSGAGPAAATATPTATATTTATAAAPADGPADDADEPAADRYYRTGDRVRWEHGTLVHLGRLDNQVKVRGYRVELGEIETALRRHPGVAEAVVLAVPAAGGPELVACHTGEPLPRAGVKAWLRQRIPAHMVPRRFVHLAALPLNANGKIDRPALLRTLSPEPVAERREAAGIGARC